MKAKPPAKIQPIRKGVLCGIAERQSSTMMNGPTSEAWTYTVGRVLKANAAGDQIKEAETYRYGAGTDDPTGIRLREADQGRWWRSYAIRGDDLQKRAEPLVGREFSSLEALKEAFSTP